MQQLVGLFCMAVYIQGCKSARSGPKSGVCSTVRFRASSMQIWIGIYIFMTLLHGADGVKVEGIPTLLTGAAGAPAAAAKPSGRTAYDFSRLHCGNLAKQLVRKRSYQRALIRAQQHGTTMYRGRCMTAQQAAWFTPPKLVQVKRVDNGRKDGVSSGRRGPEIRICSLNLGGVCSSTYDNFRNWLDTCPFDMVLLQEVHHGLGEETTQWLSKDWHFIVSPDPAVRFSGVAVIIKNTVTNEDCIRFHEIIKGRLLHVRIFPSGKLNDPEFSIDVLCIYQHAADEQYCLHGGRQKVWVMLARCLAGLPRRNLLLLGGDFNCTPMPQSGHTGPGHCPPEKYRADAPELQDIIRVHDLCLLNTWSSAKHYNMYTFQMGERQVQIDYLITRRLHANNVARQSRPMWGGDSLDFSPWRGGAKHMAIQCSLTLFPGWRASTTKTSSGVGYNKQALDNAVRHNLPEARQLQDAVRERLEGDDECTIERINVTLLTCCKEMFPPRRKDLQPRPWQDPTIRLKVSELWLCRRSHQAASDKVTMAVRQAAGSWAMQEGYNSRSILGSIFGLWKAGTRLQRVYKELQARGKLKRRQHLEDLLQRAKAASERHDTKELYSVIRTLAPRHKPQKVRIRQVDGTPLCAEAEYLETHGYFSKLFSAGGVPLVSTTQPVPTGGYTITSGEVCAALKANRIGKAVPAEHAPSGAWIACSQLRIVTEVLAGHISGCINGELPIPKLWADCHLALIPKPNKSLSRPESFRPLGIQDVAGKSFASILKQRLLAEVGQRLMDFPQYAYIAGRSTEGAIARIIEHCAAVRDDIGHCQRNVFTKRARRAVTPAAGGVQLSVDMSTAFDRVPRHALREALIWIGASKEIIDVVEKLHDQCDYHIRHAGFYGTVNMKRGVRQGCTLAPVLFAIFSCYLADKIGSLTSGKWMAERLTLYADDTHASWAIKNRDDLFFMEHCVLVIHEVFSAHGMLVNPQKSSVVLALHGKLCRQWQRNKIHKTGKGSFLCIGAVQKQIRIPVHDSMVYLGIVASYHRFEMQTMMHRLQIARSSRQRLVKILHSNRYLSVKQRIEMYMACVRSSAIYGVAVVGLTSASLNRLRAFEQKHIRAIAKSPVHLSRETAQSLYERLQIREPDEAILHILERQCASRRRLGTAPEDWQLQTIQMLKEYVAGKRHGIQETVVHRSYPCPTCGLYFANRTAMRQHHSKIHKISLVPAGRHSNIERNKVVIHEHTVDGMPICNKCGRKFDCFTSLKAHALDECQATSGSLGSYDRASRTATGSAWQHAAGSSVHSVPIMLRTDVLALLGGKNWQRVLSLPDITQQLSNYCGICGQWLTPSPSALRNHIKHIHADAWLLCPDAVFKCSTLAIVRSQPCGACGARTSSRTTHKCNVMFHLCLLDILQRSRKFGSTSLTTRYGFQPSRNGGGRTGNLAHRRGPILLSAYFGQGHGTAGKATDTGGTFCGHSGNCGRTSQQVGQGQCEGGLGQGQRSQSEQAQAEPTARSGSVKETEQLSEAVKLLARMTLRHEDELSQTRIEKEFILTLEVHGGGILPTLYQVAQAWKESREKGTAFSSLRLTMLLALIQEWLDRLERVQEEQALAGALQLGICQKEPGQELEWLYLRWDPEAKKLIRDTQRDPVKRSVFMEWLKELQQGMAASQSLLRFHSTRPLAESYQGETVTFLLTLGYRDPFMDRAHRLLGLMSGLGSTKVAAFRIRPAKMERQPLARILEERFPPPNRGYPRRQPRTGGQEWKNKDQDMDL